jgi:hypothetical protein
MRKARLFILKWGGPFFTIAVIAAFAGFHGLWWLWLPPVAIVVLIVVYGVAFDPQRSRQAKRRRRS